jgi:transcriptional regulator with XRE-family HTH domain
MDSETPGQIIGANIRTVRIAGMYSRHDLAERSGLSIPGIARLEQGGSARPRRTTIERIAKALEVPVERLLEGTEGGPKKGSAQLSQGEWLRVRPEDIATEEASHEINRLFEQKQSGEISDEEYRLRLPALLRSYHYRMDRVDSEAG